MNRITDQDLNATAARINRALGRPEATYTKRADGSCSANVGNIHLSGAYGGVSLHELYNESGGVRDVFRCGHVPKRDLYERMHAMLAGIEAATAGKAGA